MNGRWKAPWRVQSRTRLSWDNGGPTLRSPNHGSSPTTPIHVSPMTPPATGAVPTLLARNERKRWWSPQADA